MYRNKMYRAQHLESQERDSEGRIATASMNLPAANAGHDFAKVSIASHSLPAAVQPRLEIGAVSDPMEQEADQIADSVMRRAVAPPASPALDAAEVAGGEPESALRATDAEPLVRQATRSGGSPLDATTLGFMQEQFGHDFSKVRIHANEEAGHSARQMAAQAYTFQKDIVFAWGQYAPQSEQGRWLLAHELAHVVQQGGAAPLNQTPSSASADQI